MLNSQGKEYTIIQLDYVVHAALLLEKNTTSKVCVRNSFHMRAGPSSCQEQPPSCISLY